MGWQVVKVFANKISGKLPIEERPEIQEMLAFVKENEIDKVCCLEISRLGRNTLEAFDENFFFGHVSESGSR